MLDPFCGCAIACVEAGNLGRCWIGIDSSPKAVEPVRNQLVTACTDIPMSTDIDAPAPCRQNKHVGFGQREGRCSGCWREFLLRVLRVDCVVPCGGGGEDNIEELWILCANCGGVKGERVQDHLVARVWELGDWGVIRDI